MNFQNFCSVLAKRKTRYCSVLTEYFLHFNTLRPPDWSHLVECCEPEMCWLLYESARADTWQSSLLFDAGSKCCHYVVSAGRGRRAEPLSPPQLGKKFYTSLCSNNSRDQYDLTLLYHPTSRDPLRARHCHLCWGVRCEVWRGRGRGRFPGLYFVRWSPVQPWRVFTSLVTVTTDKQQKAWASR